MPLLLPVTVYGFVPVVEIHTDRDRLSLELTGNINCFNNTLSEVLIRSKRSSVALPMFPD